MDLPLIGADDVAHAPWMAVAAKPWPGTVALMSSANDSGYELNTLFPAGATFGVTLSELKRGPVGVKDRSAVLTVRLSAGAFSSTAWENVLNGANLAAIGNGTAENWELFQFEEANLVAPDIWELKGFLRGQKGSDGLMPQEWPAESLFVLMNGAPQQIERAIEARGLDRHYRVGPASRPIDDPSYLHLVGNFRGNGLRPYAPAHMTMTEDGGDKLFRWIRRTRVDGDSWEGFEVPLGEESELFLVKVWVAGELVREETVSVPEWGYSAGMHAADGAAAPYVVQVSQISTLYGAGPAAEVEVQA